LIDNNIFSLTHILLSEMNSTTLYVLFLNPQKKGSNPVEKKNQRKRDMNVENGHNHRHNGTTISDNSHSPPDLSLSPVTQSPKENDEFRFQTPIIHRYQVPITGYILSFFEHPLHSSHSCSKLRSSFLILFDPFPHSSSVSRL